MSVALARLDKDDRAKFNLGLTENSLNIVSEPGLYILILGSRKPEAKAFKRWITHEVLPSIRKTGMYVSTVSSPQYDVSALSSNLQMVKVFSETLNTLSGTVNALFKTMAQTEMEQKRQAEEQVRQAAGYTPHEYLVAYRLMQAKQMLLTNQLSIEQIAELCGFHSASHFARAFRKNNGISPSEFKQMRF